MNRLSSEPFRDDVAAAKEGVTILLGSYPGDPMLKSILVQLDFLIGWSTNGADPTDNQLEKLNFGLMASHSVEELDAGLAMHLYHLAGEIDDRDE